MVGRKLSKILAAVALAYALHTGAGAQTINQINTETALSKNGVPMHRTELVTDDFRIKYDARTNLLPGDDQANVAGFFIDNLVKKGITQVGIASLLVGNYDGKDEVFWDAWTRVNTGSAIYGLEAGLSNRMTGDPRKFVIGTIEDLRLDDKSGLKTTLEAGMLTKDALQGQEKDNIYAWNAMYTDAAFLSVGYEAGKAHVFAGINGMKDFGQFVWYKGTPSQGAWLIKSRTAYGNVDEKFYSSSNDIACTRTFVVPAFFETHLNPSIMRGDYTLGTDITKDQKNTVIKAVPGMNTPVGYIGVGVETSKGSTNNTGIVGSYYSTFSVAGVHGSVEVNYNNRTHEPTGYVRLAKVVGE